MILPLITVAMVTLAVPPVASLFQTAVLDAPSPTVSPTFGMLVAISGDRVVATGPDPSKAGGSVGQIATFDFQPTGEWKALREMSSVDQTLPGDMVLGRIALGANSLIVSDERRDGGSGNAVAYERAETPSGWKQLGRLQPPTSTVEPAFSSVIVSDGVFAAISAVDMRVLGDKAREVQASPKVYLFQNGPAGWKGLGFLQRDVAQQPTFFGAALSITSGQLVIGCPKAIPAAPHQQLVMGGESVVLVYRITDNGMWAVDGELRMPAGNDAYLGFGTTVTSDANTVVVRAAKITAPGAKVFVFRRGDAGWQCEGELNPLIDVTPGAGWGITMALADGRIVVGDPTALTGEATGYVGVFSRGDSGAWGEALRLKSTVPVAAARWGVTVRADGPRVVVARSQSEREGVSPGGALIYTLPPAAQTPPVIPSDSSVSAPAVPLTSPR